MVLDIEQSIDLALNSNHDIINVGDFNNNQLNNNTNNKIISLLTQYSFYQLIDEPTYSTEHSSSTLDLLIVNDHCNIIFTEVGVPLLNQIRYHLPIIGFLNHYIEHSTIIRRNIFPYDRCDYNCYRQKLRIPYLLVMISTPVVYGYSSVSICGGFTVSHVTGSDVSHVTEEALFGGVTIS